MDLTMMGLRIKKCRKSMKLTQEQFAEMVDVSPHYIYEIERGSKAMSLYTLNNIAASLNQSVDYILYGDLGSAASSMQTPPDKLEILIEQVPPVKEILLQIFWK